MYLDEQSRVTIVYEVVGEEELNKQKCLKLESKVNGLLRATEHLAIKKDGIYRFAVNYKKVEPPILLLKNLKPEQKTESWEINSKLGSIPIKGKVEQRRLDPKKSFESTDLKLTKKEKEAAWMVVTRSLDPQDKEVVVRTIYAKGKWMVRQMIAVQQAPAILTLKEFVPPKKKK